MNTKLGAIILLTAAFYAGCTKKSAEEYLAAAQDSIIQNDIDTATIDLKSAIQADSENALARFLLGKIYVEQGAATAAEKELSIALKYGFDQNQVLPLLAKAYNLQFKFEETIQLSDSAGRLDAKAETALLLYQALAYFGTDRPGLAKRSIQQANELSADSVFSKLGKAYLGFTDKQMDEAIAQVDEILGSESELAEAHLLKAQLLSIQGDRDGAVRSYEKYHELLPNLLVSRIFLANAYIKNRQFEEAEKHLDLLLKVNSNQPFINQLKGVVRYQAKDFENAKLYTEIAIQNGLDNVPNRIIAGISSMQQKSNEQAFQHLQSIQDQLPKSHPIQKLFAIVSLRLGHSLEAGEVLLNLDGLTEDDVILLSAASAQLIREGRQQEAQALLDKSETIAISDPLRLAQKGMMRLSLDDLDGIADLEEALEADPEISSGNTALARAYIENGLYDQALELANNWIAEEPERPNGYVLAATAQENLGKIEEAEASYQAALSIDSGNPAAHIYYANKAVKNGDKETAVEHFQQILQTYPNYIPILRQHYILQKELGRSSEGVALIQSAYENNANSFNYRLFFARTLFTESQFAEVIELLSDQTDNELATQEFWLVLSNAYIQSGNASEAANITEKWVRKDSVNRLAHVRHILTLETTRNIKGALRAAQLANRRFEDDPEFMLLNIHFLIVDGQHIAAQNLLEALPEESKNSIVANGLQSQIWLANEQEDKALPGLRAFYEQRPSRRNTGLVARAYRDLGDTQEAIRFLLSHIEKYGEDASTKRLLADLFMSVEPQEAIARYSEIIQDEPRNVVALNNLAWLLSQQGDYEKAETYASDALEIMPNLPELRDTLGIILLKQGKIKQALNELERAFRQKPENAEMAIHYAEAMIANDQKQGAAELLKQVKTLDPELQAEILRLQEMI